MIQSRLFWVLGLLMFVTASVQAQTSDEKNGITYKGLAIDYLNGPDYMIKGNYNWGDLSRNMSSGGEIGYFRYLNKWLNVGVPLRAGTIKLYEKGYSGKLFAGADANLILKMNNGVLLKENATIAPYLFAGVGTNYIRRDSNQWDFHTPVGGGLNIRLAPYWHLQLQTEKAISHAWKRSSWVHSAGFLFTWGGIQDQDGDKISDSQDACPTVFGLPQFKGCPDTDNDGITDAMDECPMEAGTKEMNGCPDTDGDGIANIKDECPAVAGIVEFNGCPDTDKDGVKDAADNCPTVAGLVALQGCPDKDNDGIQDDKDACPDLKGLAKFSGCPDSDDDGIADNTDKCPKEKGTAKYNGCPTPDTDGDGINDDDDKCISEKGTKENNGCPFADKDKDGIYDKDDACPDVAGEAKYKGCPDTDKDGIADNDDRCPKEFGIAANKGCPEIKEEVKKVMIEAAHVEFETGSAKFKSTAYPILDKVIKALNDYPQYAMSLQGHTDNQGDKGSNQRLSEARAKACYDYLISKGIKAERLGHVGYGDTQPIGDNKTAAGRQDNRRVEFIPYVK